MHPSSVRGFLHPSQFLVGLSTTRVARFPIAALTAGSFRSAAEEPGSGRLALGLTGDLAFRLGLALVDSCLEGDALGEGEALGEGDLPGV